MAPKRRRDDAGGAGNSKRRYLPQSSKGPLIPENSKGFLVSCVTGKEMLASREAIELLGQYIEASQQETQQGQQPKASGADISSLIADEVADIKSGSGQPLTWHKTNITGLLYLALDASAGKHGVNFKQDCAFCHAVDAHIKCQPGITFKGIGPVDLVQRMATDIQSTKQCKSRLCLRFIPVEHTCYAKLEDMRKLAAKVLPEAFPARDEAAEPETFAVQYEHRASTDLKRMDVINAFVEHVPKGYKVSLDNAKHTILVQLVKSCCTLAIVPRYKELLKFNVRELSGFGEGATSATAASKAGRGRNQGPKPAAAAAGTATGDALAADVTADAAPAGAAENGSGAEAAEEASAPADVAPVPVEAAGDDAAGDGAAAAAPAMAAAGQAGSGLGEQRAEGAEEAQDAT